MVSDLGKFGVTSLYAGQGRDMLPELVGSSPPPARLEAASLAHLTLAAGDRGH